MDLTREKAREWLEADGLGGFASGTVAGIRTRRYHALLLTASPTGRFVLVNGYEAWVRTPAGTFALSSHCYSPGVIHPDGFNRIKFFEAEPWPRWIYELEDGTRLEHEVLVPHGLPAVALSWRLADQRGDVRLFVRPFFSGRDYHALHRRNPAFRFGPEHVHARLIWRPYPGVPEITALTNGLYSHAPDWYLNFLYEEERARGLDDREDLASPGIFDWTLTGREAVLLFAAAHAVPALQAAETQLLALRSEEARRRGRFASPLHRAADAYVVATNRTPVREQARAIPSDGSVQSAKPDGAARSRTVIAGYPWFTDWGRDTFIALRGLCLAAGRWDDARDILIDWAGTVSEGMLPNRFPDAGTEPEFNTVDASLWYVVAAYEWLQGMHALKRDVSASHRRTLHETVEAILSSYAKGTRFGIRLDEDGLLAAGVPGVQLTWMDAKIGDWVVTPRVGKAVEVQALWLNALWCAGRVSTRWKKTLERGRSSFTERFWNESGGCLYDVVDCGHQRGTVDARFRPNQIFAVGGLPIALLEGERAYRMVNAVEERLWTPMGLRSLAPGEPGYTGHYGGGVSERDRAYHQGTVWPWLAGPFVEAWVRVRGGGLEVKQEACRRFLKPLFEHLSEAGIGHVSEIADADPPYTARGCPFQAWSLGEVLRLVNAVLVDEQNRPVCVLDKERGDGGRETRLG
jgi:predicted glycogen debranching enzyme